MRYSKEEVAKMSLQELKLAKASLQFEFGNGLTEIGSNRITNRKMRVTVEMSRRKNKEFSTSMTIKDLFTRGNLKIRRDPRIIATVKNNGVVNFFI